MPATPDLFTGDLFVDLSDQGGPPREAPPALVPGRPLRAWQREALEAYDAAVDRGEGRDFLVTATPGSGKTTFALTLARRLLDARRVERVVVVAPTDHLRTQWAEAADAAGIVLDPNLTNAVGPVRGSTRGYVTTYAQVAGKPALHAARSTAKKTLVVLDEVHHAGDGLSWGEAVEEAFDRAARRLSLTGTPFRTRPGERIPFVRYVDGDEPGEQVSRADHAYGYREALADGVVRPVVFAAYTGTARWRNSAGDVVAASLSEPSTKSVEATAWRTALDPRGQWVSHVIAAVDDRITHLRERGVPDAAGLVLASDQEDARAYAKIVERVTGEKPELILSDDRGASRRIEAFTTSRQRIAVCVRMVSEGVDVPRAAVLAWMTSYRTPLFFAQAVGRVVRARGPHEQATVFLPAVRPLLTLAAAMEEERHHVIPPPAAAQRGPRRPAAARAARGGDGGGRGFGRRRAVRPRAARRPGGAGRPRRRGRARGRGLPGPARPAQRGADRRAALAPGRGDPPAQHRCAPRGAVRPARRPRRAAHHRGHVARRGRAAARGQPPGGPGGRAQRGAALARARRAAPRRAGPGVGRRLGRGAGAPARLPARAVVIFLGMCLPCWKVRATLVP